MHSQKTIKLFNTRLVERYKYQPEIVKDLDSFSKDMNKHKVSWRIFQNFESMVKILKMHLISPNKTLQKLALMVQLLLNFNIRIVVITSGMFIFEKKQCYFSGK